MPDKKRKLKEISDTDLLEGEIITEPVHKLKEIPQADLEGEIVAEPQASPVIVDNNTIPNTIAAPKIAQPLTEIDPVTTLPKSDVQPTEKEQSIKKSTDAITWLSNDIVDNADTHHPDIQKNISSVPFHEPGSIVHDVTNPHGEPDHTSTYVKDRIAQLEKEKQSQLTAAMVNGAMESATPNQNRLNELSGYYDQQINQLKQSAGSIVGLQLFNKDYKDKKYTQAEASTAMDAATKQREDAVKAANTHLHENVQGPDKYDVDKANKKFHAEVENINSNYKKEIADIQGKTKWDDVRLGLEHGRLLGDQQAEQDLAKYNSGRPLSPEAKLKYQLSGQQILKAGNAHTVNENIAKESAAHIKNQDQIEEENQQLFNDRRSAQIANAKYNDENGLFRAIVPHFGSMSKEDVEKYGKEVGLTPAQIKKIDPESVPTSSTIWQQFAKGALNTAAPIYERAVRSAAALSGADPDKVNEAFAPGWEGQRGPGAAIVGNMPSDQNTFHNIRGAIGQVFEGAGALSTFAGEIGGVTKGLEAAGATADKAHKLANFGVMAFNGYNNAYHNASEVIGEKPADEWKRQAYAATLGIIEGKIFSINPKADLFNKAIGIEREGELMGKDFLEEFKKAKDPSFLQEPTTVKKLASFIQQSAKDNGIQVGLAVANEMSKDAINTILNPKKKQDIPEDIKNTAVSTSLAMFIPSIMGGYHTGWNKSPMMKAAAFEIGSSPERYSQMLSDQLAAGRITPQEAQQSHEAVLTMKSVVDNTPTVTPEGKPLTPDQIKDYSWSMLRENTLQKQADQLTDQATRSNLTPDKARIDPINKQIKELQGERNKILEGKTPERVPTPEPEKPKEEPAAERSVAKQADRSEELTTEENKLGSEKEKDITLQSTEPETQKETTKTTDNERTIQNDEGRQDRTDGESSQGIRRDTEVREAADSEGRNEQKENRELKTPGTEAEPQEKQPPAASAIEEPKPKKEKKNRFAKIEEKVELPSEAEQVKTPEDAIIPSEEQVKEIPEQSSEREHAPVESAGREEAPPSAESSDSNIGSEAKEEVKDVHDTNVADIPTPESETGEKPTEAPAAERSVATEPAKEPAADHQKSPLTTATEAFNKYKDAVLKKEAALEKLREQGKKKGDIDFDKKVAELEQAKNKRTEAFKAYDKEFRKDQIPNAHSLSKNIREKTKKLADTADKKATKGVKRAGTGFTDAELIKYVGNKVADLVELGENLHLAIRKALDEFRGKITKEQEQELRLSMQEGEHTEKYRDNLTHEPPLLQNKEDYDLSVDLVKEIKSGNDTFEAVMDDLHDANINPERKKAIADFIDREVNLTNKQRESAKETYNTQTLREPKNEKTYLDKYELSGDGETSRYISGETLQDVFGEDVQFDIGAKETQLQKNIIQDTANMVGLAKMHAGSNDVLDFGTKMLGDIKALPENEPVKKLLAVSGLANELHGERIRLENEYKDATSERQNEITNRLQQIKKMTAQTELMYRDITSGASDVLNAARANRIYRNTYFAEEFASRILSESERKAKETVETALDETSIPDKVVEKATSKTKKEADKEVQDIIEEKNKSEAGKNVESSLEKKETPKGKEKGKSTIERMKEKGKKKESSKEKASIMDLTKDAESKMGGKTPEEFLSNLKEKIKKKKC